MLTNNDVRKVTINYQNNNGMVYCLTFFDKNNSQIGIYGTNGGNANKDIMIQEGERIIGFKAR